MPGGNIKAAERMLLLENRDFFIPLLRKNSLGIFTSISNSELLARVLYFGQIERNVIEAVVTNISRWRQS